MIVDHPIVANGFFIALITLEVARWGPGYTFDRWLTVFGRTTLVIALIADMIADWF